MYTLYSKGKGIKYIFAIFENEHIAVDPVYF